MSDYLTDFVQESEERITELNNALLTLERDPTDDDAMENIFRVAHTLKGNCGAMGLESASDLAHAIEDLLDAVRRDDLEVTPELMDVIFDAVDELETMVDEVAAEGEIDTDPTDTIDALRDHLEAGADSAAIGVPTTDEIDAVLERFEPPADDEHDAYLVRLGIAEGEGVNNGKLVVDALIDAFDLIGTEPPQETIEGGEYGGRFDAVFGSAVGEAAITSGLKPVEEVADFELVNVTDRFDRVAATDAADSRADADEPGAQPGDGISSEEAQDLDVDELLDEFDEFDDLDELVEDVDDDELQAFDDMGDAGTFDELLGDDELALDDDAPAADSAVDADTDADSEADDPTPSADEAEDDVDDANAVFNELKDEVEMVGFDELQAELDELEFDEFDDDDEIGMDELIGDEVDLEDDTFLDGEEPTEAAIDEMLFDSSDESDESDEADVIEPSAATESDAPAQDDTASESVDDAEFDGDDEAELDAESESTAIETNVDSEPDAEFEPNEQFESDDESGVDVESDEESESDVEIDEDATGSESERDSDVTPETESPSSEPDIADEPLEVADDDRPDPAVDADDGVSAASETDDAAAPDTEAAPDDGVAADDPTSGTGDDVDDPVDVAADETAEADVDFELDDGSESDVGAEAIDEDASDADDEPADTPADETAETDGEDGLEDGFGTDLEDGFDSTASVDDAGPFADADPFGDESDADLFDTDADVDPFDDDPFGDSFGDDGFDDDAFDDDVFDDADDTDAFGDVPTAADESDDFDDAFDLGDTFDAASSSPTESDAGSASFDDAPSDESGGDADEDDVVRRIDEPTLEIPDLTFPETTDRPDAAQQTDEIQSVRVDVDQIDSLLTLVEGLVTSRVRLRHAVTENEDTAALEKELDDLEDLTTELQETVMDVRLVPLQTVTNRLPRVVRDIARDQDKAVTFEMSGEDVELDRSILDRIGDPLIHLVRNAVDHGIEPPEEREAAEKPRDGTVHVQADRSRDRVTITVEDDGSGLDPDRLRSEAVEAEILSEEEAAELPDDDAYELIFHPGLSTADEVTDVSGRGVGMDVVKRTIEDLEGTVEIDSEAGEGTSVTMTLPVSVAIDDILFFECGGEEFGVPTKAVLDIEPADRLETSDADDEYAVVRLDETLETPRVGANGDGMLVRIRDDVRPISLHCDHVHGQQEVVVKPFEGFMSDIPGLSGATVRGRGEVVNILDVTTL